MTLLHFDGFDVGDFGQGTYGVTISSTAPVVSSSTRFGVGSCLNFVISGSTYLTRSFTPSAQVFVGVAVTRAGASYAGDIISIRGDASATQHLSLRWTASTTLALYRGGTQIATAAVTEPSPGWAFVEMSATIADTGGTCEVRVDGATVINFTGDTKNAGTSTSIDAVSFGKITSASASQGYAFDDFYVCNSVGSAPYNTFLGPVRVYPLVPTGAGSSTQMTPSAGANWSCVDELPYSATDYVQGASGQRDLYATQDLPSDAGTIFAVQARTVAKKTDAGALSARTAIKSGATVYPGTSTALGSTDGTVVDLRTADPATSAAWTSSGVNAAEVGCEVV